MARATMRRWISEVPSKMVYLVAAPGLGGRREVRSGHRHSPIHQSRWKADSTSVRVVVGQQPVLSFTFAGTVMVAPTEGASLPALPASRQPASIPTLPRW